MRKFIATTIYFLLLICPLIRPASACTTFCIDTPDGPVFGANLDLFIPADGLVFINKRDIAKEGYDAGTTGKKVKWVSKYGNVTFNLAGREIAFGGMNEAGLVVGSMELRASKLPKPNKLPALNIGTWIQYILDTCCNVQDAIRMASEVRVQDKSIPSHYLVADASGNCAAFEFLKGGLVCYSGENLPVKAMSNMRYARALAAHKRGGPRWWWSNPGQSAERFANAHARSKNFNASRDTNVIKYAFDTLTQVVAAPHTKWNIVYDIPKREIWFRSVASPAVKHLSLHALDFSGKTPMLMLDVNAPIEGNVEKFFKPYDPAVNLKAFRTLCDRKGIDVSEGDTVWLMDFFESFKYVPEEPDKKPDKK